MSKRGLFTGKGNAPILDASRSWHRSCLIRVMLHIGLALLGILTSGLTVALYAASRAPIGYEDETGFHFGPESQQPEHDLGGAIPELSR